MVLTDDYDWQTKIDVVISYPSTITGGVPVDLHPGGLIGLVDVNFTDDQPVEFMHFLNEYNAATVDKPPAYSGTVRIADTSPDVVKLRRLLLNREYFDIRLIQADDANSKMNWEPGVELFVGCRFTNERVTLTPGNLPVREFAFKARYRNYRVGSSLSAVALGDGWSKHDGDTEWA